MNIRLILSNIIVIQFIIVTTIMLGVKNDIIKEDKNLKFIYISAAIIVITCTKLYMNN